MKADAIFPVTASVLAVRFLIPSFQNATGSPKALRNVSSCVSLCSSFVSTRRHLRQLNSSKVHSKLEFPQH